MASSTGPTASTMRGDASISACMRRQVESPDRASVVPTGTIVRPGLSPIAISASRSRSALAWSSWTTAGPAPPKEPAPAVRRATLAADTVGAGSGVGASGVPAGVRGCITSGAARLQPASAPPRITNSTMASFWSRVSDRPSVWLRVSRSVMGLSFCDVHTDVSTRAQCHGCQPHRARPAGPVDGCPR